MKFVLKLIFVCGLLGIKSLGGMASEEVHVEPEKNAAIEVARPARIAPKLLQLCITKVANNIKDLKSVDFETINWGAVPDDVKQVIMLEVPLNKENILFWLDNAINLNNQESEKEASYCNDQELCKLYEHYKQDPYNLVLEHLRIISLKNARADLVIPSVMKAKSHLPLKKRIFKDLPEIGMNYLVDLNVEDLASIVMCDDKVIDQLDLSRLKQSLPHVVLNERAVDNSYPAFVARHQRFFNQQLLENCNGVNASTDRDSGDLIIAYEGGVRLIVPVHNNDAKKATALRFNNDASKFIVGFKGGRVSMFDASGFEKEVVQHLLPVTAVALSPCEDIVASAAINGEVYLTCISAGTHVKIWLNDLVSRIDFEGGDVAKLTNDRVVSRQIPLGFLSIIDDRVVSRKIPLNYLQGKLNNKELLVAYIAKCIRDQNYSLKSILAPQLGLFMEKNNLFEPVIREYFRGIISNRK